MNLFTCKGTYMIDWVGRFGGNFSSWDKRFTLRVGLSPDGLPASRFRDKLQIWDGKRKTCFSPSRSVTFLPVQKGFVPAGRTKCNVFREGCDKKRHKLTSSKKFRVRERHILPRNVTNVTCHIFCHRKQWQMWHHSPKSETGSWEEIRVRPTLSSILRFCIPAFAYFFTVASKVHCGSAVRFGQALPGYLITAHHLYASLL